MEKIIRKLLAIVICALVSSQAQAGVMNLAYWTFPTSGQTLTPDFQASGVTATMTDNGGDNDITGTTVNFPAAAGTPVNSHAESLQNSGGFVIKLTGVGNYKSFSLSYAARWSAGGGPTSVIWSYSTTGVNGSFISTGITQPGNLTPINTWIAQTVNLPSSLDHDTTIYLMALNSGGGVDFDNIVATGVTPEPITYALAAFGVVFVGVSAGRFYFRRKNISPAN